MNILDIAKPGQYYKSTAKNSILLICNPDSQGRITAWWLNRKEDSRPIVGWTLEHNLNGLGNLIRIYEKKYPQRKSLTST